MLILLDCRPLQYEGTASERKRLILSAAATLTRRAAVKWLLLVDQGWRPGVLPDGVEGEMLIQRALPGRAGWRLWYDWQIPRLVKKHRPDRVMLTGGVAAAPLPAPQCVWMPANADPKDAGRDLPLYAGRLGDTLRRAETVYCFSQDDRRWLGGRGKTREEKMLVVRPAPSSSATLLAIEEKAAIKEEYAQGKEFFFTDVRAAREEDVVHLLKAFSLFKKRQLSNLQLLMAGTPAGQLQERLETYRYKQDVHWCSVPSAGEGRVAAAAYAALFLFDGDSLGTSVLDAWQAGVPVLVTGVSRIRELAGEAALIADAGDPTALAGHLMSVYKDEALRGRLIQNGTSRVAEFGWERTVATVWAGIERTHIPIIK